MVSLFIIRSIFSLNRSSWDNFNTKTFTTHILEGFASTCNHVLSDLLNPIYNKIILIIDIMVDFCVIMYRYLLAQWSHTRDRIVTVH